PDFGLGHARPEALCRVEHCRPSLAQACPKVVPGGWRPLFSASRCGTLWGNDDKWFAGFPDPWSACGAPRKRGDAARRAETAGAAGTASFEREPRRLARSIDRGAVCGPERQLG